MGLREEIADGYIDVNGLVSPHPTDPTKTASDNGPMYTAEYLIMITKLGLINPNEVDAQFSSLHNCFTIPDCMLCRRPRYRQPQVQESVDDYYAVLNLFRSRGLYRAPRRFLKAVFKYKGALNNVNPGKWTWSSFLVRQPQLVAAMVAAAFPSRRSPVHYLARLLALPFFAVAAFDIAVSGIGAPSDDADTRRLSWHLLQTTAPVSIMCWIASKLWYHRLYELYPNGMKSVCEIYYKGKSPTEPHPFCKYWQD